MFVYLAFNDRINNAKMKKILHLMGMLLAVSTGHAQTLHNGITLPDEWPPRRPLPTVRAEMPLPYMENKPEVIPVNVGRQLFVDGFLISETDLTPVFHTPDFYEGNPVLEPDREWEKTASGAPYAAPFSDGIWYDEQCGKFRMWYLAGAEKIHHDRERDIERQTFYTCYAESKDGMHWEKIMLDLIPGTNVVDSCDRDACTVWLDRLEKDPAKRWKMFNVERRAYDSRWQIVLKYSSDGIHWSRGAAQSGEIWDRTTAFFNPFTEKWALSLRAGAPTSSRSRFYVEHSDPEMAVSLAHRTRSDVDDRNVVFWFGPDDKELRHEKYPEVEPGIYNFDAIAYESIILGQYSAWCGPENHICGRDHIQKRNVVSLGYSRDGFHFYRPTHEPFMNVNETEGAWNWGNMQSINGTPLIVGDSLYFYSSGRRLNNIFWDGYTSTGLARLRRDGFVSMQAGKEGGHLTTEKISFDGKYLFVNVSVPGKKSALAVEVLDENGDVIPGFSAKECNTVRKTDSTRLMVTWKGHEDLSSLAGRPVRLRFQLSEGELYAFWISPWESGESRGYTAGGGPGLNPCGIDVKVDD